MTCMGVYLIVLALNRVPFLEASSEFGFARSSVTTVLSF